MLGPDEIAQQQELLATYRRTLVHMLTQQAQFSAGFVPAHVANGIAEARANIRHVKQTLRDWGEPLEDYPEDAGNESGTGVRQAVVVLNNVEMQRREKSSTYDCSFDIFIENTGMLNISKFKIHIKLHEPLQGIISSHFDQFKDLRNGGETFIFKDGQPALRGLTYFGKERSKPLHVNIYPQELLFVTSYDFTYHFYDPNLSDDDYIFGMLEKFDTELAPQIDNKNKAEEVKRATLHSLTNTKQNNLLLEYKIYLPNYLPIKNSISLIAILKQLA
jgi:hypothetical protein